MLESMVDSRLPTRSEATDVANAILDGTDAVMLSGESAIGKYPEEAVAMLSRIAAYTESQRPPVRLAELRSRLRHGPPNTTADAITSVVETALDIIPCAVAFVPTRTGTTARMISRLNPSQWIVTLSRDPAVCQELAFSGGVEPVELVENPENWRNFARTWLQEHQVPGAVALLAAPPRGTPRPIIALNSSRSENSRFHLFVRHRPGRKVISEQLGSPNVAGDGVMVVS